MSGGLRVGVDVGGTFTKAVAVDAAGLELVAHAAVPTSHDAEDGVAAGVAAALEQLLAGLNGDRHRIELVAFSTTQAMNALLEGDVRRVGVVGLGSGPELRLARKRTRIGSIALAPGANARDLARGARRDARARRGGARRGARPPRSARGARRSRSAAPSPSTTPSTRRASRRARTRSGCPSAPGTS